MKTITIGSFFILFALVAGLVATSPVAFADHSEVIIEPVQGSGFSGCQDEGGCYNPMVATVDVGGKVIFQNTDTVAHTFTAGTVADGPSGEFDSGLAIIGSSLEYTADTVGEIPHFCLVHPWMTGLIVVQEAAASGDSMDGNMMMSDIEGNVNVGVLVPLTGDLASQGEEDRIAAELAIADFNEYLANKGSSWSISGVIEDSQTNPVAALDKVTAMHAKNAKIVIGPATSSNLRNISGYTAANDMMVISFGSTAPSLALPGDNIFRTVPDDNNQGPAIANLMASRGMEVLVPVWRGDTWGDGLKEATENSFEGVVGEGIRYNPETPEFSASSSLLADQVRGYVDQYGADKVGILIIAFAEVTQFMQSAEAHDVLSSVKWFGSDGSTNVQSLVDDPIGLQFAYDTDFTTLQFAASGNEITQKVNDKIVEELGRVPTVYAYCTYDAIWLAGLAMEAAGTTDTGAVIDNMLPVAADFVGSVGSTKLNAAGDLDSSEYAVWTIRDDQWLVIGSSSDMSMMGDNMMKDDDSMMKGEPSALGALSDGTQVKVYTTEPMAGEMLKITVKFMDSMHVNYDLVVMQNGVQVLSDMGVHEHTGKYEHMTSALPSSDPIDVTITFQGFGVDEISGPTNEVVTFTQIVPEFGTIAMMVLGVAIISIIAITAKSRVIPRL